MAAEDAAALINIDEDGNEVTIPRSYRRPMLELRFSHQPSPASSLRRASLTRGTTSSSYAVIRQLLMHGVLQAHKLG